MKKNILLIIAILNICFVCLPSSAQDSSIGAIFGLGVYDSVINRNELNQKIAELSEKLNLSEEQLVKVNELAVFTSRKIHVYEVQIINQKRTVISKIKSKESTSNIMESKRQVGQIKARINRTINNSIKKFEEILDEKQKGIFAGYKPEIMEIIGKNFALPTEDINTQNVKK